MPYINEFEIFNQPKSEDAREGSATAPPIPPAPPAPSNQQQLRGVAPQGAGPSPPLLQIGAIAAAIVVRNGEEGDGSDSDDSFSSDGSDCQYCCVNVPFRLRVASTPGEIGGDEMVDAADDAMNRVLAQRLARAERLLL